MLARLNGRKPNESLRNYSCETLQDDIRRQLIAVVITPDNCVFCYI